MAEQKPIAETISSASRKLELYTERLHLRPLSLDNADDIWELEQDPLVSKFLGNLSTPERSRRSLEQQVEQFSQTGRGLLALRCDGQFIGYCGFVDSTMDDGADVEIVCAIKQEARHKGFAAEAAERVLRWGLDDLKLRRIIARVAQDNTNSMKLVEKLGMTRCGERKDPFTENPEGIYQTVSYRLAARMGAKENMGLHVDESRTSGQA